MGTFHHFQHKRFRIQKNTSTVELSIQVKPKNTSQRKSLIPRYDRVAVYIENENKIATLLLDDNEIDALIYELSRLERFNKPELNSNNG